PEPDRRRPGLTCDLRGACVAQDPLTRGAAFVAAATLGVGAELAAGGAVWWSALDLLVGLAAAAAACSLRELSSTDRALGLAFAALWFLGTPDGSIVVLAYRAPLLHLLLRIGTTRMRGVVLAGWVASFLPFGVASPLTAALAGVAVLALLRG